MEKTQNKTNYCFKQAADPAVHLLYIYDDVSAYGEFDWKTWSYTESETSAKYFRDQLAAADVIVANKSDRATPESEAAFTNWWQQYGGERLQVNATQGNIELALLDLPRRNTAPLPASPDHVHSHGQKQGLAS